MPDEKIAIPPDAGKQETPPAPVAGQVIPDETRKAAPAPDEGQAAAAKAEEELLARRTQFAESPDQKAARLEKLYSASSREVRRKQAAYDKVAALLEEQGIELDVDKEGVPRAFKAGKGFDRGTGSSRINVNSLPEDVLALAESDPQRFADAIADETRKVLARLQPTRSNRREPVAPERIAAAADFVAELVEVDGEPSYPTFKANLPHIQRILANPATPQGLKDLHETDPELANQLLCAYVDHQRGIARAQAAKEIAKTTEKKTKSANTPPYGPAGGGGAELAAGDTASDTEKVYRDAKRPGF